MDDVTKLRDVGKIAIASAGAAGVAFVIRTLTTSYKPFFSLLMAGVPFVLVYVELLFLLKVPTPGEVEMVTRSFPDLFYARRAEEKAAETEFGCRRDYLHLTASGREARLACQVQG